MDYIELNCRITPPYPASDMLMNTLSDMGYESFVENDEGFLAYIPETFFKEEGLKEISQPLIPEVKIEIRFKKIKEKNWNELWERNFKPVKIGDWLIRAPFHESSPEVAKEVIIAPKMAFGTGHHETTRMMVQLLDEMELAGKSFLDVGCGTGILTIMAAIKGANKLTAVDIDHWAFENTLENLKLNKIKNTRIYEGDVRKVPVESYNVIAANIHLNVLLEEMPEYKLRMGAGSILMLSGFYEKDFTQIETAAQKYRLEIHNRTIKNKWVAVTFINP